MKQLWHKRIKPNLKHFFLKKNKKKKEKRKKLLLLLINYFEFAFVFVC